MTTTNKVTTATLGNGLKVILRESMRGIVPNAILDRRDKLAYAPPQQQWLRGPLRPWVADNCSATCSNSPRCSGDMV